MKRPAQLSGSPSETVSWTYDDPTAFNYGIGRLTGTTDPTGATAFRYDHLGRLRYEQKTLGGAAYVSAYVYDTDGNRTSLTYPSGRIVTYTYDLAGRQLSAASGGTTLSSSGAYLPFGPLTGFTFGNGLKKAMSYDSRYRLTDNKLFQPPNNIARYSYTLDPVGNITGIQDVMDATYSRTFGYDDLNRLVTANTGTSLWRSGSYAYDAMGNLTSRSLGLPAVDDGTVLSLPGRHLRAATAVTGQVDRLSFTLQATTPKISVVTSNGLDHTVGYDAAGNETSYFASRAYSPRNLMSTVTDTAGEGPAHQITYGYDYRGVRVSRTESPTDAGSASLYFFYTPELQLLASTVDDSNNVWGQSAHIMATPLTMNREVVWFAGQPVAEYGPPRTPDAVTPLSVHHTSDTNTPANNLFYTFTDHLGTPLIQTDPSTTIVWRAEHEPYGNVYLMRKGSRADQPLRFPGQEAAMTWEGTEENYNIFRWYLAEWGRYTQGDPQSYDPFSMTLRDRTRVVTQPYEYSNDNPIIFVDPNGLCPCSKQCESGTWWYIDRSGSAGLLFGKARGQVTFWCSGSSTGRRCSYNYSCKTIGLQAAVSVGFSTGRVHGRNCKCADRLPDPNGLSLGIYRNFGLQISNSPCEGPGLGWGVGYGAAPVVGSTCSATSPIVCQDM